MVLIVVLFIIYLIELRTMNLFISLNKDSQKLMTKIGTALLFLKVFLLYFLNKSTLLMVFLCVLPSFLILIYKTWHISWLKRRFQNEFPMFLMRIQLNMSIGMSFRSSFKKSIEWEFIEFHKRVLNNIYGAVVFSQHNNVSNQDQFIKNMCSELKIIDQNPHHAKKRIEIYIEKLKFESEFRRKSGQLLYQLRLQSIILSSLYFALFIYANTIFDFSELKFVILWSFSLFCLGSFWLWNLGKRIKWTV